MPISKQILERYLNAVFVETGTNRGEGVQAALDAGFTCIYSTEIAPYCHGWCDHRFWDVRDKVFLFGLDSREFLRKILPRVNSPVTFWLDAHFCESEGGSRDDVPLLEELKIISEHHINFHTILIDDVRLMGTPHLPVKLKKVKGILKRINPMYTIHTIDSSEFPGDIIVAEL